MFPFLLSFLPSFLPSSSHSLFEILILLALFLRLLFFGFFLCSFLLYLVLQDFKLAKRVVDDFKSLIIVVNKADLMEQQQTKEFEKVYCHPSQSVFSLSLPLILTLLVLRFVNVVGLYNFVEYHFNILKTENCELQRRQWNNSLQKKEKRKRTSTEEQK
jgi:predicted GTPase